MSEIFTAAQVNSLFPKRDENTHKGDYGYVTLIGGCVKYSGAIRLAALAKSAMRSGAGVCTVAAPKSLTDAILPQILESTFYPLHDNDGDILFNEDDINELMERSDVIAIGMGIGNTTETRKTVAKLLAEYDGTLIVDADGINAMAKMDREQIENHRCRLILTPHLKEFSRLSGKEINEVQSDPEGCARQIAKELNAVVLLKGHVTTVCDDTLCYRVEKGCAGMATGGSGDVLSGILAAVAAANPKLLLAATAAAAYINGLAGEIASDEMGEASMISSDTVACIPKALKQIRLESEAPQMQKAEPFPCFRQRPEKGKIVSFIILALSLIVLVCGSVRATKDYKAYAANLDSREEVEDYVMSMEYLYKDIYIDGILINNYQLYRPWGICDNRIYVPLTEDICSALGIEADWDENKVVDIYIKKTSASHCGAFYDLSGWNPSDFIGYASGNVNIYISDGESEEKLYPQAEEVFRFNDGEVMYIPVSMLASSELLDISLYYDELTGLYVSTDPEIPAQSYYSENNASYIKGRAEYILGFQPDLGLGICSKYEYIFRHEANTMEVDEDLLMAIAGTESKFNSLAQSSAGARGIMQIMPDTAKAAGIDPEDLYDVEVSVQYGANYIKNVIKNFKGDLIKALSSYNFGGNAVLAGEYDTAYATTVISRMEAMQKWLADNGYSNEFYTVIECTK